MNPRRSIDAAIELGRAHGFAIHESDSRDIDCGVSVDLEGHGELIELHFREAATGYLRWDFAFEHGGNTRRGGQKVASWKQVRELITYWPAHAEEL